MTLPPLQPLHLLVSKSECFKKVCLESLDWKQDIPAKENSRDNLLGVNFYGTSLVLTPEISKHVTVYDMHADRICSEKR